MDAMYKTLASVLLILIFLLRFGAADDEFPSCNCAEDGFLSVENLLMFQRVSDFLIAVAYFSIPIELLYFVSCSNVPYKWVLFQFIAFIVLCGMTHLLNGWTYGPHTFQLMLALTIFKFLTALVSFATAITLVTLIPLLLKVKVREFMLKKKTWDLGREVCIIKKQKEASLHVRMLTQEIRKSLDRHTILYTTLDKLSEVLDLQNCAVWTPNETRTVVNLTHELKERNNSSSSYTLTIPTSDPDVRRIKGSEEVQILHPSSALAAASSGTGRIGELTGDVAAIRMPMLRVCDFNGGTPERIQSCYAILVSVLPTGQARSWGNQELEILRAVADQVAVALSHAAALEESQLMREKLAAQNRALQQAKEEALIASQARNSFQMAMNDGMRRPMHSIMGLVSMMQDDPNLNSHKKLLVDSMVKTSNVLSVLINDVMDSNSSNFPLEMRSFCLRSMIKEATCVSKCLCVDRGYGFAVEVERSLPDYVMGDERRVFQVILHMVGNLLNRGGFLTLRVSSVESINRRPGVLDDYVYVMFEVGINIRGPNLAGMSVWGHRLVSSQIEEGLSFSVCKRLVQMMQGNIWVVPNPKDFDESMAFVLKFQIRPSTEVGVSGSGGSSVQRYPDPLFRGLKILLVDADNGNRAVTRKLLEKLGCKVTAVTSGEECLNSFGPSASCFEVVLLDLHLPDLDGFEVTSRIRKFSSRRWPLIVAVTTADGDDIWGNCVQIGMNGVIQKPILLKGIADELRRVLSVAKMM